MVSDASSPRYAHASQVESSRAGDRVVLFHRGTRTALVLNPTASWLWTLMDQPQALADLVSATRSRFADAPAETAGGDVAALVDQLVGHGMLVTQP